MTSRVEDAAPAEPFDDLLRWIIPSDSNPHESYVVELHTPPGYSICQCKNFECRMLPILSRGISPQDAIAQGLIKLREKQRVEDVLKCKHILDAEKRLALAVVKATEHAQKKQATEAKRRWYS